MPTYIIHHDGVFNEYNTISDGARWVHGQTLAQLKINHNFGEMDEYSAERFAERIDRATKNGCSMHGWTLQTCIDGNRAGDNESALSREEFISAFLTLPAIDQRMGRRKG